MAKYVLNVKYTKIENATKDYLIEFPEVIGLEPITSVKGSESKDAKDCLWGYIKKLLLENKNVPDYINKEKVKMYRNQSVEKMEVDTEVILDNLYDKPLGEQVFSAITAMDECEEICAKVLADIKEKYGDYPHCILEDYYQYEKRTNNKEYKNLIELGELFKSLK